MRYGRAYDAENSFVPAVISHISKHLYNKKDVDWEAVFDECKAQSVISILCSDLLKNGTLRSHFFKEKVFRERENHNRCFNFLIEPKYGYGISVA